MTHDKTDSVLRQICHESAKSTGSERPGAAPQRVTLFQRCDGNDAIVGPEDSRALFAQLAIHIQRLERKGFSFNILMS